MLVEQRRPGCISWIVTWLASALAVWLTARFVPGVEVDGFGAAMWAALVLGFLNALVRPVLVLLTLPVTVITLGAFLLIINATVLTLADWLLDGFRIDGFGYGILAAIVLTLVSTVFSRVLGGREEDREG
jgi:putative membrane protein